MICKGQDLLRKGFSKEDILEGDDEGNLTRKELWKKKEIRSLGGDLGKT